MRRDADLMDDIGDDALQPRVACAAAGGVQLIAGQRGLAAFRADELADAAQQRRGVAGLVNEIIRAECGALAHDLAVDEAGEHDDVRAHAGLAEPAQQLQPVELRQHEVEQQHVRLQLADERKRIRAVVRRAHDLHVALSRDEVAHKRSEFRVGVGDENAGFGFHNFYPPKIRCTGDPDFSQEFNRSVVVKIP